MTSPLLFAPQTVQRHVFRIVRRRKAVPVRRLHRGLYLVRELCFDLLDLVDILLDVEQCFCLRIPNEVPFLTLGDLVDYVAGHTPAGR